VNPFAAVYGFWLSIPPPIREPIKSSAVSGALGLQTGFLTLAGAAIADGHATSPQDLLGYCAGHWWGALLGIIVPAAYRAQQGFKSATQVVVTSAATSTPNVPDPPPKP
jgi:hypothetical protein